MMLRFQCTRNKRTSYTAKNIAAPPPLHRPCTWTPFINTGENNPKKSRYVYMYNINDYALHCKHETKFHRVQNEGGCDAPPLSLSLLHVCVYLSCCVLWLSLCLFSVFPFSTKQKQNRYLFHLNMSVYPCFSMFPSLTGVLSSWSRASTFAPRLMKNLAIATMSFPDAVCNGVLHQPGQTSAKIAQGKKKARRL